ncbi:D-glycero-beta-D-manno-heptose-7-phosphate kinase [Candidatus Zixiibacteriota bacterium]
MDKISKKRLDQILPGLKDSRVMVLGDLMLDHFIWGKVSRISPEAPVPVVRVREETQQLGGAANVAHNIRTLGATPVLVGLVGDDEHGRTLAGTIQDLDIATDWIVIDQNRMTTMKTRVVAHSQQVVRADWEDTGDISGKVLDELMDRIAGEIDRVQGLIISDYGKGVITVEVLRRVLELAREKDVFVAVDPKESHFDLYKGVSLITPNQREAGQAFGKIIIDEDSLEEVGRGMLDRLDLQALLITRGEEGMSLFESDGSMTHFPTMAREVYDVTGAGDTVVGSFVVARTAGAGLKEAALISNHAAGIAVGGVGTTAVSFDQLADDLSRFTEE